MDDALQLPSSFADAGRALRAPAQCIPCSSLPIWLQDLLASLPKMLGFSRKAVNQYENPFPPGKALKMWDFFGICGTTMGSFIRPVWTIGRTA
jgi:hypothetical protein